MARKFKVIANIPVLGANSHQSVTVEGSSWMVALGKAARMIKRLPVMHRRRVTAISLVLEQLETAVADTTTADNSVQGDLPMGVDTDETVDAANEALNQAANDEAERLIVDGPEGDDQ